MCQFFFACPFPLPSTQARPVSLSGRDVPAALKLATFLGFDGLKGEVVEKAEAALADTENDSAVVSAVLRREAELKKKYQKLLEGAGEEARKEAAAARKAAMLPL